MKGMPTMFYRYAIVLIVSSFLCGCSEEKLTDSHPGDPQKIKIMAFGGIPGTGGQPSPADLIDVYATVDQLPIQAFNLNLTNNRGYFVDECMTTDVQYTYDDLRKDVDLMNSFQFNSGKKLFPRINIAALLRTDWFDDDGWRIILNNIKVASQASAEIGAIGFCLDNEQYNYQPFNYTAQANRVAKSFHEYQQQTRKRGRQFATALLSHVPEAVLIIPFGNSHLAKENCDKENLYLHLMGLWPAFIDGMMDATDQAEFIDGHEDYSAETFDYFRKLRHLIKEEGARYSADPARYKRRVRAAFPIWLKATEGIELDLDTKDFTKNRHTPEEFEHVVHYAMLNSDGWIWLYAVPYLDLPSEYLAAIDAARKPHRLDFDFTRGKPIEATQKTPPDQMGLTISAKHRLDNNDDIVFAAVRKVYQEIYDFPKQWKFRFDRRNLGVKERWHQHYNPQDWIDIEIGDWYGCQLDSIYTGYVWYRTTFFAPQEWAGKKLLLAFGAVDEQAWIWMNGRKAGESAAGPEAWNSAFEIDISSHVRPNSENEIVVRVHNAVGPGGIWKSVKIFAGEHQNLQK